MTVFLMGDKFHSLSVAFAVCVPQHIGDFCRLRQLAVKQEIMTARKIARYLVIALKPHINALKELQERRNGS